jgi:hypothetical protein
MLYNPEKAPYYVAALQTLEDAHQKALNDHTEAFLKQALAIEPGTVIDVAPHPKQYFSKSRRFLVFQLIAHAGRDLVSKKFAGVEVSVLGVFLKDDGTAFQSVQSRPLPEGQYHVEQLALRKSKYLAADPDRISEDQTHQVKWKQE